MMEVTEMLMVMVLLAVVRVMVVLAVNVFSELLNKCIVVCIFRE